MMSVPYLIAVAATAGFVAGAALSGGTTYWVQKVKLDHARNTIQRMELNNMTARAIAENQAVQAADKIAALQSDLAQSLKQRRVEHVEVIKEAQAVASPTRQCLSAPVIRVLRNAQRRADAQGHDPGRAPAAPAAAAPDTRRPQRAASEQAVAVWGLAAITQDGEWREKHRVLSESVRALPCVKVE